MSLSKMTVEKAIKVTGAEPGTSPDLKKLALQEVLPILHYLLSQIPWYKRLFFGAAALIGAIDDFLEDLIDA